MSQLIRYSFNIGENSANTRTKLTNRGPTSSLEMICYPILAKSLGSEALLTTKMDIDGTPITIPAASLPSVDDFAKHVNDIIFPVSGATLTLERFAGAWRWNNTGVAPVVITYASKNMALLFENRIDYQVSTTVLAADVSPVFIANPRLGACFQTIEFVGAIGAEKISVPLIGEYLEGVFYTFAHSRNIDNIHDTANEIKITVRYPVAGATVEESSPVGGLEVSLEIGNKLN